MVRPSRSAQDLKSQSEGMSRIAILYPGGLGAVLGRAFIQAGNEAITCLDGRSEVTRQRAVAAGFRLVPSLGEVAESSDLVISLVPPAGAVETARRFAACIADGRRCCTLATRPMFLDANSVSPQTKQRVAKIVSDAGARCVDGAFFGPTNQLGPDNLLALSGPDSALIAPLFHEVIEIRQLGPAIGQASSLKMASTMLTKALPALFLEIVSASAAQGQVESILGLLRRFYPGIMSFLERTLPTYPLYVARRKHELEDAAAWLRETGQWGIMTQSAVAVLDRLQRADLEPREDWPFDDLVHRIADMELLRGL
jgi:3-hydroxyisobutyrate dehydrogenase-like beta-hydroxyacid dehydrogenase